MKKRIIELIASLSIIGCMFFLMYGVATCNGIINLTECSRTPMYIGLGILVLGAFICIIFGDDAKSEVSEQ